jgi:hypothetical protein
VAHVGYLPAGRILGLSKLAPLVEHFAVRPQTQERLTKPVAYCLLEAASRANAMASTSGAWSARNQPMKVSRGDGSPGSGSADSPSRRYCGVGRIFLGQHYDFLLRPRCQM